MRKYLITIFIVTIVATLFSEIISYHFVVGMLSGMVGVLWCEMEEKYE